MELVGMKKVFDFINGDMHKSITHRIVGFNNQNFGYVALGTDWTMGTGESKKAYITIIVVMIGNL